MKKLRNILISGIVSVCMIVTSVPIDALAQENVQEENGTQEQSLYEIVSFEELTEEVSNRIVPVGTVFEELDLPQTLTVSYRLHTEEQGDEEETDENPGDKEDESVSDNDPGDGSNEDNPGDDIGEGENESDPGEDTGEGDSESNPGEDTGEGDSEGNPGDNTGEGGNESVPGGDTGEEGSESNPGEDIGEEGGESNSGGDIGEGGSESSPEDNSEGTGSESTAGEDSADEAVVTEKTIEVSVKEYKSQPEFLVTSGTLTQDGEITDSDENETAGGESVDEDSDSNSDRESDLDEEQNETQHIETAVIENITWQSAPEYDGDTEGCYIFTPVLPGEYILADGVVVPEIVAMVGDGVALFSDVMTVPGCGTISTDTVWTGIGTLSDGELIVEPGVTLTISNCIDIRGKVTIKGGGMIKRGSAAAYFRVNGGADLTLGEITLEGNFIQSGQSMISAKNAKITLNAGCRIQNCNSSSAYDIATIYLDNGCNMTINGGTYRNNKAKGFYVGSFILSRMSKLYVYGGNFIDNIVYDSNLGGCILDGGLTGNETHIYGGYFEGNKSTGRLTSGGGAIQYISRQGPGDGGSGTDVDKNTVFELSGDVQFCGDGVEGSGTDGFYLDFLQAPRKIHVGSPITSPVYFYLKAKEGYVIARGSENGYILTEKDMKQVRFTDVGNSGKQWYAMLDKEKNEIYLSETKPPYGLYVYYSSNGATGKVEDNTEYASGADVTVKSGDVLSMEGYTFKGWNTRPDGKGTPYSPGSSFKITGDITLYAIFEEGRSISANFYSGGAGLSEVISAKLGEDADSVTITTPELKEMDGWEPVGWSRSGSGYEESVECGDGQEITISEDTNYYGVYKKKAELSYDANGWQDTSPAKQSGFRYANVHDEITYKPAAFVVGNELGREGYTFLGWSLEKEADSSAGGACYGSEDTITLQDSATLYAQMVDDIAPVLGEAAYNNGYRGVGGWIVHKKDLVVTVPITEKGSGVNRIVYTFAPEGGEPVKGEALMEDAGAPAQTDQSETVWLEVCAAKASESGTDGVSADQTLAVDNVADAAPAGQTSVAESQDTVDSRAGRLDGEVGTTDGEIQAKITIAEDYKGTISLMCRDNAGNESPLKLLTAQGGGVIVEDNAPLISFLHKGNKNGKAVVEVTVYDDVDEDDNSHVTGGIASVTYQIDRGRTQSVKDKGFAEGIVETCTFEVEVSGAGEHTVMVTSVDNAGNESSRSTSVRLAGSTENKKETTVIEVSAPPAGEGVVYEPPVEVREPEFSVGEETKTPMGKEPKTGANSPNVEIYATLAMISGLLYILLYFIAEQGGMTESEKKELVARLIAWAKRGGKLRRYGALAAIFCVLFYYHSIGKNSAEDFRKIRIMNQ